MCLARSTNDPIPNLISAELSRIRRKTRQINTLVQATNKEKDSAVKIVADEILAQDFSLQERNFLTMTITVGKTKKRLIDVLVSKCVFGPGSFENTEVSFPRKRILHFLQKDSLGKKPSLEVFIAGINKSLSSFVLRHSLYGTTTIHLYLRFS
jgi:hypothetical protein